MKDESAAWRTRLTEAAGRTVPGDRIERWALGALLVLAAVLRCWDLPHLPYTHDEISALVRLYPSLGETIGTGVIALDTHPPGVQVFEWCWTRLFGVGEVAVKLPFIALSVMALFLLYRCAHAWWGGTVAVPALAVLATVQYTVMYGQMARPYAVGLFTTALLADQLTRYAGGGRRRALIGIAAGAVLSAYTHHFALLLAALMYGTGFLLLRAEQRRGYLLAGAAAAALYLPNLPILAKQFGAKGLEEWLRPPDAGWFVDYAWWVAHCSGAFAIVLVAAITLSVDLVIRRGHDRSPFLPIALCWGLVPMLVGFAYSVWRAPVLQYSVVLFSFPYLLLALLHGLRHLGRTWALALSGVIAVVSVATLIDVRQHYGLFYRSKYEAIVRGLLEASQVPGRYAVIDAPPQVVDFYLRHWNAELPAGRSTNLHGGHMDEAEAHLLAPDVSSLFLGISAGASAETVGRMQRLFPFLLERHDMNEGQTFLFGRSPAGERIDDLTFRSISTAQAIEGHWWRIEASIPFARDSTANGPYPAAARWDLADRDFGLLFEAPVDSLIQGDNDLIEAYVDVPIADPASDLRMVMELKQGDRSVHYREAPLQGSVAYGAIKLADVPGHGHGTRLRAFVWNAAKRDAQVARVAVQVRAGDPWLYGMYEPLKGPQRFP